MDVAIDRLGRMVVPKAVRERLGLTPGSRLELVVEDTGLRLSPRRGPARVEDRDGVAVLVHDAVTAPAAEEVRAVIEEIRREPLQRALDALVPGPDA